MGADYYPSSEDASLALAFTALFLWGSWASLEKVAQPMRWQIFFVHFASGVALSAVLLVGLLGPSPLFAGSATPLATALSLIAGPCCGLGCESARARARRAFARALTPRFAAPPLPAQTSRSCARSRPSASRSPSPS